MGGVSSPLTEEAVEALLEAALDPTLEATVFFLSLPSSARLACRAAFEADTMVEDSYVWSVVGNAIGKMQDKRIVKHPTSDFRFVRHRRKIVEGLLTNQPEIYPSVSRFWESFGFLPRISVHVGGWLNSESKKLS